MRTRGRPINDLIQVIVAIGGAAIIVGLTRRLFINTRAKGEVDPVSQQVYAMLERRNSLKVHEEIHDSKQLELGWTANHPDRSRSLVGQWIALEGDELISNGSDLIDVLNAAHRAGHTTPFLTRVQEGSRRVLY